MALTPLRPVPPDHDIAMLAAESAPPIVDIASRMGLGTSRQELFPVGHLMAKIDAARAAASMGAGRDGKVVLVTAMTPQKKGSGKTLTTIALTDALNEVLGASFPKRQRATAVLRQPSMGPVFGMKGGAAGGGYSQVIPLEDVNLHLTGDIHAITAAHNLLSAMAMAYIGQKESPRKIKADGFMWPRAVDMVDRSLRTLELSPNGKADQNRYKLRYVITAASEVMATLGVSADLADLRKRLSRILVGLDDTGTPVRASDLEAHEAMAAMLLRAGQPNLVQSLHGNGAFVHTGPFANIAHGNASVAALTLARRACDYVVTEAGFAADLGGQKFMDLVCRMGGFTPSAAVIVMSTRDLANQGPLPGGKDPIPGLWNLRIHVENLRRYGVPVVIAMNRFTTDTDEELAKVVGAVQDSLGVPCVPHTGYADGARGAIKLGEAVVKAADGMKASDFKPLYDPALPILEKIETIARTIYRANDVVLYPLAAEKLAKMEAWHGGPLQICMSKTQYSITDDEKYTGDPSVKPLRVTDARYAGGPGWAVALCGEVMEMPGMTYSTAGARKIRVVPSAGVFGGHSVAFG